MTQSVPKQLLLGVQLRDETNFENFCVSDDNQNVVAALKSPPVVNYCFYLWGSQFCGRTHLIQALCHDQAEKGLAALYLPLRELSGLSPDMLQGANSLSMVCLDDVDAICGKEHWERALFNAYNDLLAADTQLVITASCAPQQLPLVLPDLKSRLQAAVVYQLATPDDEEKRRILCLRARNRGMELSTQLAEFLVQRADRSLNGLIDVLDQLDQATLERGRRLTIPLIKEVLNW